MAARRPCEAPDRVTPPRVRPRGCTTTAGPARSRALLRARSSTATTAWRPEGTRSTADPYPAGGSMMRPRGWFWWMPDGAAAALGTGPRAETNGRSLRVASATVPAREDRSRDPAHRPVRVRGRHRRRARGAGPGVAVPRGAHAHPGGAHLAVPDGRRPLPDEYRRTVDPFVALATVAAAPRPSGSARASCCSPSATRSSWRRRPRRSTC